VKKDRISMDAESSELEQQNPFSDLDGNAFSKAPQASARKPKPLEELQAKVPKLGRVEVRRETQGRAGKAVTTIRAFRRDATKSERQALLRELKKSLAVGGFLRSDGGLEVQGDHRERVMTILCEKGYLPVSAGG
jgi:translation initiation factor 1